MWAAAGDEHHLVLILLKVPDVHVVWLAPQRLAVRLGQYEALGVDHVAHGEGRVDLAAGMHKGRDVPAAAAAGGEGCKGARPSARWQCARRRLRDTPLACILQELSQHRAVLSPHHVPHSPCMAFRMCSA